MKVERLLEIVGLTEYLPKFVAHAVDGELLQNLTSDDLREIGVAALGHRKRILAAIRENFKRPDTDHSDQNGEDILRRQITVVFADLVGSTRLSRVLDTEDLRNLTRAYQGVARDCVERFDGHIAQYLGDGVLAYFGYPKAHEDDAARALRAALDLLSGLKDLQSRMGERLGVTIEARIGIETGSVIVGGSKDQDNTAIGETPNLAARLQSIAEPGTIVVGDRTKSLLGENAQVKSLGRHKLKGFDRNIEVWRVDGIGFGLDRFGSDGSIDRSQFVGREEELAKLQDALSNIRAGSALCIHVVGEPGIGKSRLLHEFLKRAPSTTRVLSGYCAPFGAASFHPFAGMLSRRAEKQASAKGTSPKDALVSDVLALGSNLSGEVPYLLRLAGLLDNEMLDPETIGSRTQRALVNVIKAVGQVLPTILFINDIHWVDERTESVLDDLVTSGLKGVLLVFVYRPEYTPPWKESPSVRCIELCPLDSENSEILFRSCSQLMKGDISQIVERGGGNPLFIEELAAHQKTVSAVGHPNRDKPSAIPTNLSGLLLQRVDNLSPKSKALLKTASVVGRRFHVDLIMRTGAERELALKELVKSSLLIDDGRAGQFRFKHALVQDAIYESLLSTDRRSLHSKIAHRLEDMWVGQEKEVAEELARHFEIADEPVSAARYSLKAGEKALELFALRDAAKWFERSLSHFPPELSAEDERLRAAAVMSQIQVSCWDARFDEMLHLALRELDRMRKLGEEREISRMLSWLGEAYLHSWRYSDASIVLKEALAIGNRIENKECIGHAIAELVWLHSISGKTEERHRFNEMIAQLFVVGEELEDRLLSTFGFYASWARACHCGRLGEARALFGDMLKFGAETSYPPALTWGNCMAAYVEALSGNLDKAMGHCDLAEEAAECAFDRLAVDLCKGVILQECGRPNKALEQFERAERRVHSVGSFFFGYASVVAKGRALIDAGKTEEGIQLLSEAINQFDEAGHHRAVTMAQISLWETQVEDGKTSSSDMEALIRAVEAANDLGMIGHKARGFAALGIWARAAGHKSESVQYFTEAKSAASQLEWLALEQRINSLSARLAPGQH
jgi:class 3 adenylate cyclase/tetratricopeptide (TPR) repeat protein